MAALSTLIAGAGLAVAGASAVSSYKNQKKALKEQESANEAQRKQADLSRARQNRDAIRQARMAFGAAQQSAESQGVGDSSASQGGLGSIQTQLGSELSFLDQFTGLSDQASIALGNAAKFQNRANTAKSVGAVGMAAFSNSDAIANIFGNPSIGGKKAA